MHHNRYRPLLLAAAATFAWILPAPAAAQDPQVEFALPAQDLPIALRAVSQRTGQSILADGALVRGRKAPALAGRFTVEEALRRLLAGSGLAVRRIGGALVVVEAGGGESPEDPTDSAAGEQTIIVTGTHLRGAPPSAPVIVIDRDAIDRSGASSAEQLMRQLPQNTQGGVNQENFGVTLPDQDVTDHGAGVNLRGLGQRATLVLLDGRRLAPSGFGDYVDISLIPVSLIDRVEVLTDGASAVYGSDAVGGVVNFVLRDRLDGLESAAQAGVATQGGGEQWLFSQAGGADWGSGHGLLGYEYRGEQGVRADQRAFTLNLRPEASLLPRERRHSVLASVAQDLGETLRLAATGTYAHRATERTYFAGTSALAIDAHAVADAVTLGGELSYDFAGDWRARVEASYALSETDQRQTQPGGVPLVNARAVRSQVLGGGVRVDGTLADLPGGALQLALGAEARRETFRDAFESSSIAPTIDVAQRNVESLFGEVAVPLVSQRNRAPGLERLELSAAGRFDRYGGTGSTFQPRLGLVWSPLVGADLRASYGTSFRAPLLSEIGGSYNVFFAPAFLVYKNRAEAPPGGVALLLQGSNPDLRPETSRTLTFGADLSPAFAPGLSLSLNYYSIRFSGRIALPTRVVAVAGDPAFEPIIDRSPDLAELTAIVAGAQTAFDVTGPGFTNGHAGPGDVDIVLDQRMNNTAETRTRGLDLTMRYAFSAGASRFVLDANVNHVLAFADRLTAASPATPSLDRVYGPLAWRARAGGAWSRRGWGGSAYLNYAGAYRDDRTTAAVPVAANATLDLSLSYTFADTVPAWLRGTQLSLYAENLFDSDPPALRPDPGSASGLGYDPVNASGRGRFVSLQLRKPW